MKRSLQEYGFPVLAKDLVEQAERKRTYLSRVIFIAVLSVAFLGLYGAIRISGDSLTNLLGTGRQIFSVLIQLQLAAIYLYVPVLMSGAIVREKERNSLTLLLLTRLRAGEIVLEKLLGGLTPVFTLQFVALPLLAVAYSLGGVSTTYFLACVYLVFLTCFQVGSFTLMMSAYCRTTVAAFALSYLFAPGIGVASLLLNAYDDADVLGGVALSLWTPSLLEGADGRSFTIFVLSTVPALLSVATFLLLTRRFLFVRIDVPAKNYGVQLLRWIDGLMESVNRRVGDVMILPDRATLPEMEPVAWREVAKKSLGKPRYLVRVLLLLQIPSVVVALGVTHGMFQLSLYRANYGLVSTCVYALWGLVVLIIGVLGTSLVVSERTQQTLDVLLTTPISRAEIIRQKTRGLARLIKLLWIPFFTLFLIGAWARSSGRDLGLYLLAASTSVFIYLPLLSWLATYLGLRSPLRLSAFMRFLVCVALWSAPPVLLYSAGARLGQHLDLLQGALLLSPATMILIAESSFRGPPADLFALWAVAANAGIHGCILYRVRRACLRGAERYLHGAEKRPKKTGAKTGERETPI